MPFTVYDNHDGQPCRLAASGDIDVAVADELADLGKTTLRQMTGDALLIDLADVTFMDSTGLAALVKIRNESIDLNKRLTLANVPKQVSQILNITALDTVLPQIEHTAADDDMGS